jgi:hypothetical protein
MTRPADYLITPPLEKGGEGDFIKKIAPNPSLPQRGTVGLVAAR